MGKYIVVAVLLSLLFILLSFFFGINQVGTNLMEPSLKRGQTILVRRSLGQLRPERSDIVLFTKPDSKYTTRIGRAIALPSESTRVSTGNIYIDDNNNKYKLNEEYVILGSQTHATEEDIWIKLDQYQYLVLSDDRKERVVDIRSNLVNVNDIEGIFIRKLW